MNEARNASDFRSYMGSLVSGALVLGYGALGFVIIAADVIFNKKVSVEAGWNGAMLSLSGMALAALIGGRMASPPSTPLVDPALATLATTSTTSTVSTASVPPEPDLAPELVDETPRAVKVRKPRKRLTPRFVRNSKR